MKIKINTNSLELSKIDTIIGIIFIEYKDGSKFPGNDWYDFPVRIVGWWLNEMINLLKQTSEIAELLFMDGPKFLRVSINDATNMVEINFVEPIPDGEDIIGFQTVGLQTFVKSLTLAAEELLQACKKRNWQNKDVAVLGEKLSEFVTVMENKKGTLN